MKKHKTVFHWSGGKDSSLGLRALLGDPHYSVELLLTTANRAKGRVSMHGVRTQLIEKQAERLGIPLVFLWLPEEPGMDEYNAAMKEKMGELKTEGFTHAAFGDIFLEDLRAYREKIMKEAGFESVFPVWKEDTQKLARRFVNEGFKAVTVCIKQEKLGKNFAGRLIDTAFIQELPDDVDPCGEYGEFHTFVFDGPILAEPVPFKKGEIVYRGYKAPEENHETGGDFHTGKKDEIGFWFCDLI